MSHDLEAEPIDQGDPPGPGRDPDHRGDGGAGGALARWSTEFVTRYALDHPDAASPAQAAQEVRAGEIRQLFRSLTAVERPDGATVKKGFRGGRR